MLLSVRPLDENPGKTSHIRGSNRKWSEKYGLTVYLCCECHRGRSGVHFNAEIMDELHKTGQQAFEKHHTRAEFMKIFGRNYLENENEKSRNPSLGLGFLELYGWRMYEKESIWRTNVR